MSDKLLYGKNLTQSVVSLEANDEHLELFIQQPDGSVKSEFIANKFWILTDKPYFKSAIKLVGNLHYKWGMQFTSKEELNKWKSILRKKGADFYTIYDDKEAAMVNKGITYFKGLKHNEITVLSFDIETNGIGRNSGSRVFLISNTFRKAGVVVRRLFSYDEYENDGQMLQHWAEWVREIDPSILLGHNVISYDLPYMNHVAKLHHYDGLPLGRDNSLMNIANYESSFRVDGSRDQAYNRLKVYGREIIDTYFTTVRWDVARNLESYGLKNIVNQLGLEIKDRQFYDAATIKDNYLDPIEWEKIKEYAKHDADDSLNLFDYTIAPVFYLTQTVPKSFQGMTESASGSQVNSVMVRSYLQDGHSIPKADEVKHFQGAISFGVPGVYDNVLKIDFAALYPSIMLEYEVYDEDKDPNKHFLQILDKMRNDRLYHKKMYKETGLRYHKDMDDCVKTYINSNYGFLSTRGLNYNCPAGAEFVTAKGRELLAYSIKWATGNDISYYEEWMNDREIS